MHLLCADNSTLHTFRIDPFMVIINPPHLVISKAIQEVFIEYSDFEDMHAARVFAIINPPAQPRPCLAACSDHALLLASGRSVVRPTFACVIQLLVCLVAKRFRTTLFSTSTFALRPSNSCSSYTKTSQIASIEQFCSSAFAHCPNSKSSLRNH